MDHEPFISPIVADPEANAGLDEALTDLVIEGLRTRGRLCVRLLGESMWPTIPPGALVEVEQALPHDVRPGHIVVWPVDGRLVAHRVVRVTRASTEHTPASTGERWFITKGDNCSSSDRRVSSTATVGRVARVHGVQGLRLDLHGGRGRADAILWVARWRLRSALGRVGRILPCKVREHLLGLRDGVGHQLSRGYDALLSRW